MRRRHWISLFIFLIFAALVTWLWWVRPKQVNMAAYAPADSMLYLEANQPLEIAETIYGTGAWKAFENFLGKPVSGRRSPGLQRFIRWTGVGPIESVILARAQIAVVITDMGTTEQADTLRIRPEGAVLMETHTSERRIRAPVEQAIKTFAEKTYGQPILRRTTLDGVELLEWSAPTDSRQIVGAIIGSLVILGNSEHAVQNCVAVSLGRRESLKDDPELTRVRRQLGVERPLTFGYVPTGKSARLLAVGIPVLLDRAPGDSEFQRFITAGAEKIFGSVGWTSSAYSTGIEDRYLIALQPSVITRLKPNFDSADNSNFQIEHLLPNDVYSVTSYRFSNPAATWQSLKTAVSSQVDALSTIVFSSLLKSSLLSYGINDPEVFLDAVDGELLTLRFDDNGERSVLIAGMRDSSTLRQILTKKMGLIPRTNDYSQTESFEDSREEVAAVFISNLIVLGSPADVRRYAINKQGNTESSVEKIKRMTFFAPLSSSANIVTYTDDSNRVRSFISAIIVASGRAAVPAVRMEEGLASLPFSVTETTLDDPGIRRITRSPLGQFSSVLPLLIPEPPGLTQPGSR